MKLSDSDLKIITQILAENCKEDKCFPRKEIFKQFCERSDTQIEEYQFKKDISDLIKNNEIKGYQVKPGRNGGVVLDNKIEVAVKCSEGDFIGNITTKQFETLLKSLKPQG
jgi:hypothetical protein